MGRIADALKRAQQERETKLHLGLGGAGGVQASSVDFASAVRAGAATGSKTVTGKVAAGTQTLDPIRVGTGAGSAISESAAAERAAQDLPIRRPLPSIPRRTAAPTLSPTPQWDVHSTVVSLTDRSSSIAEQYRAVRTWLLSRCPVGEHSCVAVTSSVANEGKSVTTANLAVVMSEVRHMNVLLVDADLRRSSLNRLFKMEKSPGLADVLAGRVSLQDAIATTPIGNLSFLPAGNCFDLSPAELFNSRTASAVFDEIRERYHHVLVDTPPVQWVSDVGVIGAMCTGIVMVVRMNKTASNMVRQSVRWLQSNNLNVMGCIASMCNLKSALRSYQFNED